MFKPLKQLLAALVLMTGWSAVCAAERSMPVDLYIAPGGSDEGNGSREQPYRTLGRVQAEVRGHPDRGRVPVTIHLGEGVYRLSETLVFTAEDGGSESAPVTYAAETEGSAVISGGIQLETEWKPWKEGVFVARAPAGLVIDELFVNGRRQLMARYPNHDPKVLPYNGWAADAFSTERAANWSDPAGGYIHAMHASRWGGYHYRITGKNEDGSVAYEGGWQNNRQMGMHAKYRFVENIFEELDAPGEWYHDAKANQLYFYPPEGIDLDRAVIETSRLRHLVEFRGSPDHPTRHLRLEGITFRHAARSFMETREPLLRSDWTIYRGGAVVFDGAEDCALVDCEFDQVGGNAVFVNNYNRRIAVRGTRIHGSGASGVCFVGDPDSVRNPLFEYNQRQSYKEIDTTPGPRTDNYPADCVVEDCLINDIGLVEKQAAGVQVSMAKGITVRHCSIYDVGRAGINISEGTFGGHLVEFCDVFDTVRETGDHGSFNSWGRDRFWGLKDVPPGELPELALLDVEKNIIRNSRWRCDHGWDVDLDDGSSNYEIYNNLFLSGGLKLREGFHRKVYNNIAVNNSLHPHVWYEDSRDEVTGNIWMGQYRPARMNHWGKEVDRNFFTSEAYLNNTRQLGCDAHSLAGDPLFVDPPSGDYRIRPGSPALEIGFKNFPMDQFGVQKPGLKAIARTPQLPVPNLSSVVEVRKVAPVKWMGARLRELSGEEFSAFGVSQEVGGLQVLKVPADSITGLAIGDVVQKVNGQNVASNESFLRMIEALPEGDPVELMVVRHQNPLSITTRNLTGME